MKFITILLIAVVTTSNAFSPATNAALSTTKYRGGDAGGRKNNARARVNIKSSSSSENNEADNDNSSCSITMASFNLIKGAVGSGVLSLPAGVAAIGDVKSAIIPASSMLFTLGAISAYTFHLLGRLTAVANVESADDSSASKVTSIGQLWEKEIGASSSWLISAAIFLTCFGTCLAYSIILGDTLTSLAQTFGINGLFATRRANIAAISLVVYPLSCLKSLAALAPVSLTGIV
eukprot:scaffold3253_cov174-Skeletonema_marinoi.AAC.1